MRQSGIYELEENGEKDTGLLYNDVSSGLVEHHLVEDVHDLTNKFIILLSGCKGKKI